ncbi:MAG: DNA primase [Nitrospirota bacterium]
MSLGLIPQDVIEQIKERTDILDVVSGYVTLSKAGQNFKGLCPFHSEKTPSFMVSPSRQIFHCFGCGAGGNVFTFVMKMEGTAFPETVRELGRRAGIEVPVVQGARQAQDSGNRERLEKLNDVVAAWFRRNLFDAEAGNGAMAYLRERGMSRETLDAFGFGFAPQAWDGLLRHLSKEGYTTADMLLAGVVVPKEQSGRKPQDTAGYYDRFRSRVMFPIFDLRKRVIGFGGRILGEGEPKYLNSPETPLFNKGRALYGLERAREAMSRTDTLIVVEGYFDAIALHQAGIRNVAATLGTALTPDHVRTIRRFVTKVVLLFDPDPAGVRAALRTLDLFVDSGIGVKVVSLPAGDDPDTFMRKEGAESFLRLQESAPSLLDFAVERSLRSAESGTIEDRIRSVDEILRILQKTAHRIEKEECTRRVAERLGINQKRLIERYPELLPKEERRGVGKATPTGLDSRFKGSPEERDLIYLLLQGQLSPADIRALNVEAFSVPACHRIVEIALRHVDEDGQVRIREILDEAVADAECGSVATELSMSERHYDDIPEHVHGCLSTLERKRRELALGELIVRLRVAEQEGRTEEVRRLNAQVNEIRLRKADSLSLQSQHSPHNQRL